MESGTIISSYTTNENFEEALKTSKETTLNGHILKTSEKIENISLNEINITFAEVCHLCGKVLSSRSGTDFSSQSEKHTYCECVGPDNCFAEDVETGNKRDSGFHTLKRGESQKIDDTGQQTETALSSASSADSAVSVGINDASEDVRTESDFQESLSSIVVDEYGVNKNKDDTQFHENGNAGQKKTLNSDSPNKNDSPEACAEKLYNFKGYKRSEVARIIGKNTEYSRQVGHEYLKLFDFTDSFLIDSYREFLSQFALLGETQERERILSYFSQRYVACNPDFLDQNPDSVHTLICALTLLNTDLHAIVGSSRKKMTYKQFATNLSGLMPDKSDYPPDLLISLYSSVKKHPLPWGGKEQRKVSRSTSMRQNNHLNSVTSPTKIVNRSLSTRSPMKFGKGSSVDSSRAGLGRSAKLKPLSHNQGLLWRKLLLDSEGKKVSIGKRGWKVYSVALQNLELHIIKRGSTEVKIISLHHCLAEDSSNDSKRQHVFRITLADSSITLYQASSDKEARKWVRDINKAAALLSAAPLCSPVGSQLVFRKALLPSAPSTLPPETQLNKLQELLREHEHDLEETETIFETEKSSSEQRTQYYHDKIVYLKYEINKYQHYIKIIQIHLRANSIAPEDLKSNLEGSDNGSMVSVTPSEPPLASPSPLNYSDNFVFSETDDKNSTPPTDSVFLSPAHLVSPQHRNLTLTPTSSLPNLSPILESPKTSPFSTNNNNLGSLRRRQKRELLYESSLNDSVNNGVICNSSNNSNHLSSAQRKTSPSAKSTLKTSANGFENYTSNQTHLWNTPRTRQSPLVESSDKGNSDHHSSNNSQTFPVERFEMRIANMESSKSTSFSQYTNAETESISHLSSWSPYRESVPLRTSLEQPFENMTLSRVKGRREKKGIERYSYMQAISPPEES